MKECPDNTFDVVITDPPYLYLKHKLDRQFDIELFCKEIDRVCKKEAIVVYFGRGVMFGKMACELSCYFKFTEEIAWNKGHLSNPCGTIGRIHELINIFVRNRKINKVFNSEINDIQVNNDYKRILSSIKNINSYDDFIAWQTTMKPKSIKHAIGATKMQAHDRGFETYRKYKRGSLQTTIIDTQREHFKFIHPTQKPLELIRKLVRLTTQEGDMVFDPFLGSGTTALACKEMGIKCVGCEIDAEYYQGALKRLENVQSTMELVT
jgi:site-specific DNA-methyltransferase (adenine-specific)